MLFELGFNDISSVVNQAPDILCTLMILCFTYRAKKKMYLQRVINEVTNWTILSLKTTTVLFHPAVEPLPFRTISPRGLVHKFKFLGVIVERKLSWALHINFLKTAYRRPLDILHYLSHKAWDTDRKMSLRLMSLLLQKSIMAMQFMIRLLAICLSCCTQCRMRDYVLLFALIAIPQNPAWKLKQM